MGAAAKFGEDCAVKLQQSNRAPGVGSQGEKLLLEVELRRNSGRKLKRNGLFKVDYRLRNIGSRKVERLIV